MDNKGCALMTSNGTYLADIWVSSIKMSEEAMTGGVDYCRPVKMSHKRFGLSALKNC